MTGNRIIECVPNFSEGRDMGKIKQITDEIESVEGVILLDVDPGRDTNRTVVTFVGEPEAVCEAAFRAVRKAAQVIDMSKHSGAHPRIGATDVCPLVPIAGVTMEETVEYARALARRVGEELSLPVYCYESAALEEKRRNLANIRAGEYEGLKKKLEDPSWKPDFGPARFDAGAGTVIVGARDFLVAFNINLNTTSIRRANAIAFDVRERGREKREGNPITGRVVRDEEGNPVMIPGSLKAVKAIGWYIPEYGFAQISMNLINIGITPVHMAFDEVCRKAEERGVRVTGSELVGLIPLKSMLDAGRYFLHRQQRSAGVSDDELIRTAVRSMGLSELKPFNPEEKIIEYILKDKTKRRLVDLSLSAFAWETSSESPAPGGGSVSAAMGALGAALGTMVANLSSHKRGWDGRWEEFASWAERGVQMQKRLLELVDEDTEAYNAILDAFGLPKKSDEEKAARAAAVEAATLQASLVPLTVMKEAFGVFDLLKEMTEKGNPNSVTDGAVGVLAVRACIRGAFLNVRINVKGLKDRAKAEELVSEAQIIDNDAARLEEEIIARVSSQLEI
ncbi:MAG: glutamate formimidoyltransferase [Bacteroidales bacterium]|nr:glutamate formimidoyltransferase [Bacteroidales bacterium]HOO67029.1 glutamate formimidoyltransferase [Bacteroidales bacterium]HPE22783.1 glutamate formimidoyltransferase [Bacteroidales bacterium]HPJ06082.1 glutamate formimidoyltransferase [Bacteroidales bacterium]HPQ64813.1 glutamate formimidoyltransferase [Bacteroidales bacterium]